MPVPFEYDAAGPQFQQLLRDARDLAELATTNQSYTMVQGVLVVFRARLDIDHVVEFAQVLPAVARAVFFDGWNPNQPVEPFADRTRLTREVQQLRADHNYAPDTAISIVAAAMRRNVDERAFDRTLNEIGPEAVDYWTPTPADRVRLPEFGFPGSVTMAGAYRPPPRIDPRHR